MAVVAVGSRVHPLAPGLADLARMSQKNTKLLRRQVENQVEKTEMSLLMWQVSSLLHAEVDLSDRTDPYAIFLTTVADMKVPLPGALLRDLLRFEDSLLRATVVRRAGADVRVLTQAALDDIRLAKSQTPSFALRSERVPLWLFKVADDAHKVLAGYVNGYSLTSRLTTAPNAPLQVRAAAANRHHPPVRLSRRYEWAEWEEGELLPEIHQTVQENWPDLVGLPVMMLLDVVASLPVTDPAWTAVPAVWQEQVKATYAAYGIDWTAS